MPPAGRQRVVARARWCSCGGSGPARVAQPGAVWLAGATGHPILPFHVEADRAWAVRSWDRHQVPKPGATVRVAIGEPLYVAETDEATLEQARLVLETRLLELEQSLKMSSEVIFGA